jgi:nucleotide-binding universal stress UspA family protein
VTDHVLVPVDGSPLSFDALRHALADFPDASITVLHVVDLFEPDHGVGDDADTSYEPLLGSEEWYARVKERSEDILDEARSVAADRQREIETASEIGDPKRIVVDYAAEEPIDHIVIGAHGRPDEDRALLGGVAEVVARRAVVPVTLVR